MPLTDEPEFSDDEIRIDDDDFPDSEPSSSSGSRSQGRYWVAAPSSASSSTISLPPYFEDDAPTPLAWPTASWGTAEYGQATDRGRVRSNNEDSLLAIPLAELTGNDEAELGYVFAVADGMGGAAAGERASRTAIEGLASLIRQRFAQTPPWDRDTRWVRRQLRFGFERIDGDLVKTGLRDASQRGSGTTMTVALAMGSALHIAHVGDSRAYLYREGRLMRLTRDHTLAQALIESGALSCEEAVKHSGRHVLINVLGSTVQGVDVDFLEIELRDGDRILVCSDGLNEIVADSVIASILGDNPLCQDAADELIAEALLRGGPDNVTAIVARAQI